MQDKVHDQASDVSAEGGVVLVDGPDGVAVALTPKAASETSDRLLEGSVEAQGQIVRQQQAAEAQTDDAASDEKQ